jgi:predicted Fe-Mo cluster-binding NifX family protein
MTADNHQQMPLRIAIPAYGNRIMPRFGMARVFYLVDIGPQEGRVLNLQLCRWDPRAEPSVSRWLNSLEANGVICDGIHPRFQTALRAEGLWVHWGAWGEIDDVLDRCLSGALPLPPQDEQTSFGTCCRPNLDHRNEIFTCPKPKRRRNKS